ncbi:2Fe-2S iron-sulfur cluster-binding protein [Magnetospira sp. QH-2]|uniref:2Fe-2S iron-sulfur cluster-binding protein n=1 Tax=Magnetospira sp. (strain QH-2) TaxID=1288970 RepID=UPI0003E80D4F|nr:2Fe-2S iron-sulfur cluster-binding protein [Magnetospira sp. QH-2]CCQ74963.1 2Fe-2S ferredoxin [Magnetospira sp. QH-2]
MPTLTVTDAQGVTKELDADTGLSVMEILREAGYPVAGECNGSLACATCHVIIDPNWFGKLEDQAEEEEDILDTVFNLEETSRLACQIMMSDDLSGLAVSLPS